MPTNILMPALSPTMEKGNLAKWLKKEGDTIKSGDIIAEIETDKATMEVEAVDEGVLARSPAKARTPRASPLLLPVALRLPRPRLRRLKRPRPRLLLLPHRLLPLPRRLRPRPAATAPSPRPWHAASPRRPGSISPPSRVPARMAA